MTSHAPRHTGPRVLIEMMVTTAATVKTYTYPAVDVLQASTSTQDHALCVHPTVIQLKQGHTHALDVQARLPPILGLLNVPGLLAHTGMKHLVTIALWVQQVKKVLSSVSHVLQDPDH